MNITTHIRLLKDIGIKPYEVMGGLNCTGEASWSGVRTAIERWSINDKGKYHIKEQPINMKGLLTKNK